MERKLHLRFLPASLVFSIGLLISSGNCNNYGLLSKLEMPDASERFADRYYMFVSSWQTMGDMSGQPYAECASKTGVAKADCACTKAAAENGLRRYSGHEFKAYLGLTPSYHPPCRAVGYPSGCATNITGPWYNTQDNPVMPIYTSSAFAAAIGSPIKFTEKKQISHQARSGLAQLLAALILTRAPVIGASPIARWLMWAT